MNAFDMNVQWTEMQREEALKRTNRWNLAIQVILGILAIVFFALFVVYALLNAEARSSTSSEVCHWKYDPGSVMPTWLEAELQSDVIKPVNLCNNVCPPPLRAVWIAPGDLCTLHASGKLLHHHGSFNFCNHPEFEDFNDPTSIGYYSSMHVKACISDDSIDFLWHADPPRCVGRNGIPAIREDGLLYCAAHGSWKNPYTVPKGKTIADVNSHAGKCNGGAFNSDASGISSPRTTAYCVWSCWLASCHSAWFECKNNFVNAEDDNVKCPSS